MAWELFAIWSIVAATVTWFVRDEVRIRQRGLLDQARLYATDAAWRHRGSPLTTEAAASSQPRTLTDIQRKFAEDLRALRQT